MEGRLYSIYKFSGQTLCKINLAIDWPNHFLGSLIQPASLMHGIVTRCDCDDESVDTGLPLTSDVSWSTMEGLFSRAG